MASLSTHVLDTALGRPAKGLGITLERKDPSGQWQEVSASVTDDDGRVAKHALAPDGLSRGTYQLTFATGPYLARVHGQGFYPYAPIVFEVTEDQHYHVPLLLSPYGLSTYRGS
jgi:5-hydroxyisourate hydrolase